MSELETIVASNSTLCLNVANPGWDDARGYLYDAPSRTLYFPVTKKYTIGRDLDRYEVLVWSEPRIRVIGRLSPAQTNEDIEAARRIAIERGVDPAKVDYMLLDQRNQKARKNRYKLAIEAFQEVHR